MVMVVVVVGVLDMLITFRSRASHNESLEHNKKKSWLVISPLALQSQLSFSLSLSLFEALVRDCVNSRLSVSFSRLLS